MKYPNFNPLLAEQIEHAALDESDITKFCDFLSMVNASYEKLLTENEKVKRKLSISSKRLKTAHQTLEAEHYQTKSQLSNIVDHVRGVIFETDIVGNFTYLNQAWEKYTGFSVCESTGKNCLKFLSGADECTIKEITHFFESRAEKINLNFRYQAPEQILWVELRCKRIMGHTGIAGGYIGTLTDITKSMNTQIALHSSSLAKDSFMSTMSHEIRTPLNAVTGIASILLMDDYLPHQKENLMALHSSGKHLLGLINDLLDFNKLSSGKVELVYNEFNLDNLLEEIQSKFSSVAREKNLKFTVSKGVDLPKNLKGDVLKLNRVIENLLSNAFKFTESGLVNLFVQNKGYTDQGVAVQFKVSDTGIGIPADRQEAIFESFVQANSDTAVRFGGTGLGLAICKELLEMQNSKLHIDSISGKGSKFKFTLTFGLSKGQNYTPGTSTIFKNLANLDIKVLVAEDNKLNVLILKKLLSRWGVCTTVATDGQQLIEIYKNTDADLILMDIQMPVLDGYQTADYIRSMKDPVKSQIPIIALTALAQSDIELKTKEHHMNGYMLKPFNPESLYDLLKKYSKPLMV
ncbi:MAG: ATP-binding protein [Leeuwenhoekiella sp.]